MTQYYQKFCQTGHWRILVYSGDVDSVVPFIGTQRSDSKNSFLYTKFK